MQCPGSEMENVKLLQCYKDAAEIYQMSVGNRVVIIGTSFIGIFCIVINCLCTHFMNPG